VTTAQSLYLEGVYRMHDTDLIDTQESKAKLDRGNILKVVMTLGEWDIAPLTYPARCGSAQFRKRSRRSTPKMR
jgi:hypothetical protein